MGQERKRSRNTSAFVIDVVHVLTGILIVILAILAFLSPEDNMILFPVIFLLASGLNFINGFERMKAGRGQKKKKASGLGLLAVGTALLLLCVISAVTIWWG